jgi:hypothetical protein
MCVSSDRFLANQRWCTLDKPIYKTLKIAGAVRAFRRPARAPPALSPRAPQPVFQEILQQFDARKVARQITVADSVVFRAILLEELNEQRWLRPDASKTAPRVTEMITGTNRMAVFVARAVLLVRPAAARGPAGRALTARACAARRAQEPKVRGRRKVLSKMIALAQELYRARTRAHGGTPD